MPRRQKVIWSPVEVIYLRKNKHAPLMELAGQLAKSVSAVKHKLGELKQDRGKIPLLGPTKNKRSRIGKRADCGGQFFRSSWEANVWRYYTRAVGDKVEYEPTTFTFTQHGVKRGQLSYTPDFRVTDHAAQGPEDQKPWKYIEVKGYLSSQDRTKLRRFKKFYPQDWARLVGIVSRPNTQAHREMVALGVPEIRFYADMAKVYKEQGHEGWEA